MLSLFKSSVSRSAGKRAATQNHKQGGGKGREAYGVKRLI